MKSNLKKNILPAAAIAAIALIAGISATGCKTEAVEESVASKTAQVKAKLRNEFKTEPISVKAIKVEYTDNIAASVIVGSVEPAKNSVVNTIYPGRVKSINVHKGQRVNAGDILAVLDAQNINSAYDAAKAVYDQAADALGRVEKVYGEGGVSEARLIEVRTQVAKAEASLRTAEKAKNDCIIQAPYSGVVGEIYTHEGVEMTAMAPVAQLLDIASIEVHASIPENEYSSYSPGMAVRIEVPAAGKTLDGVLAVKGVDASKFSRSYDCTFKFTGTGRTRGIMPGMICKVMLTGSCQNAIVVPASAVMIDGKGRYVWCCNGGRVTKRHITAGGFSGKGVIVTDGLEEGELLVVEGSRKISEGMSGIRVIEQEEK